MVGDKSMINREVRYVPRPVSRDNTILLIHANGVNGSINFTDEYGHSVTSSGNAYNRTSKYKFGTASAYFDGNAAYLSIPDSEEWNFNNDFTVDLWANFISLPTNPVALINQHNVGNNAASAFALQYYNGSFSFGVVDTSGNVVSASYTLTPTLDTWYHIAGEKMGNLLRISIDGVPGTDGVLANPVNNSSLPICIGYWSAYTSGGAAYYNGYMDEIRITMGKTLWIGGFEVPTSEYSVDSNTKLLLHCNGTNGGNTFTDESGKTVTPTGGVNTLIALKEFGTASAYFDGTGYLTIPHSTDFHFSTNDFTIDFWAYVTANASDSGQDKYWIGTANSSAANTLSVIIGQHYTDNKFLFACSTNGTIAAYQVESKDAITLNVWEHWACIRRSNVLYLYRNGVFQSALAMSVGVYSATGDFGVGRLGAYSATASYYVGYLDEVRISPGIARWNSNFTPPLAQSDRSYGLAGRGVDPYTRLMLHMEGLNGGTSITDECVNVITNVGAVTNTTIKKFGQSSLYFNGSSYLTIPDSEDWNFGSGDWTIDLQLYIPNLPASGEYIRIFTQYGDANNYQTFLIYNSSGQLKLRYDVCSGGSTIVAYLKNISLNAREWTHIALAKYSGVYYGFVNGALAESSYSNSTAIPNFAGIVYIGRWATATQYYTGYMDELRVSKGIARWIDNFTPPRFAYGDYRRSSLTDTAKRKPMIPNSIMK